MRVDDYLTKPVASLLDVGCNVGAWLQECVRRFPEARLARVEDNLPALECARATLPVADLRHAGAEALPFPNGSFQYVTCMEVLEHLPSELRAKAFQEMRRVLRPGGRLLLSVPHAGWFAWLDSNNMRHRLPAVYRSVVSRGGRDANYAALGRIVEWHHHFTVRELDGLAGCGWRTVAVRRGGLFVQPLMDLLSWPFYRLGKSDHPVRRAFERLSGWDGRLNFGRASYGVLIVLERVG